MHPFAPRKIVHIEIGDGLPTLSPEVGYPSLYVVFWWYGIPMGDREIPADELPMSPARLAAWAFTTIRPAVEAYCGAHEVPLPEEVEPGVDGLATWAPPLARALEHASPPAGGSVSVVVCTRDRPEQLARCLRSLQALSPPPEEILVVDNAARSDATRALVDTMPGIRYVVEQTPGLDRARNAGIRHSTSDIIAFADDDVTVHTAWVARLRRSFADPGIVAVTGLVLAAELETEAQYLFEKHWSFNRGYRALTYDTRYFEQYKLVSAPTWQIGAGANMAFRREVFERVGYFDERLDVGAAGCSGDSEFWYRILAEGGCCRYEPTAVVYHYHRRHSEDLRKQLYYYMRGHVAALLVQFETHRHWSNLGRLFFALPKHFLGRALRGLRHGFKGGYRTVPAELSGCLSGVTFYWQHRRTRPLKTARASRA